MKFGDFLKVAYFRECSVRVRKHNADTCEIDVVDSFLIQKSNVGEEVSSEYAAYFDLVVDSVWAFGFDTFDVCLTID